MCCGCSVAVSDAEARLKFVFDIDVAEAIMAYVNAKLEYSRCDGSMDD